MRILLCNCNSPPSLTLIPTTPLRKPLSFLPGAAVWTKKTLITALTGALSLTLLASFPSPSLSRDSPSFQSPRPPQVSNPLPDRCTEEEKEEEQQQDKVELKPEFVTNEEIVQEAWQIVNDSFLDTGRHRWSPQSWEQKKEDISGTSIQTRSKAHELIKRMLASLGDPYTRFLSPAEFSKMARYDITGIGINIREVSDDIGGVKLKVQGLILDGPAHTAGVRQGDEVIAVNGEDVLGKSAFEVSSLLQGPNETFVTIKVRHGNCGPTESLEIQRQLVARTPVFYRLEQVSNGPSSVGYTRLKEFNALARKDLVIAMKRLQDMGASYFILDLRDNLGGLVQAGIEIAKLFLNKGETIIYTVGRDPQYQNNVVADTAPLVTLPVVVLVNNRTASASEIVASALHDNCRAVLVGERTFGKGLIQSVFELRDGSGKLPSLERCCTASVKMQFASTRLETVRWRHDLDLLAHNMSKWDYSIDLLDSELYRYNTGISSSISRKPPLQEINQRKQSNQESRLLLDPSTSTTLLDNVPIVNPTTPGTTPNPTSPSTEPITNPTTPVTTPTAPVTTPATETPTPTTSAGGSWCIANQGASPTALQVALDYACGYGGADCSAIQTGGSCYEPNTIQDHASFAFNDYYQKHPAPTSCVFGGTAQLTNTDPSKGNCHYAASSPTSVTPPASITPPATLPPPDITTMTPPFAMSPPFTGPGGDTVYGSAEPTGLPSSASSVSLSYVLIFATMSIVVAYKL
ncbi:hypothetical protein V6N12_040074 [Hibiscus sabdariffa]|uniref:PDZ domain-containing protein n=1 Tax=Hibiscus sabdariffa TaxID=183260 RepID=A0ABR2E2L9_9ROSI